MGKGSYENLTMELFIKWTTNASNSTIKLVIFSSLANSRPSLEAHISAETLSRVPQFLAKPFTQ